MHRIAMVWSTSRVILKGLTKPGRPHIIQQLDDKDSEEVDVEVKRSVWEVMMEKKIQGIKVWVLIAQIPDCCWAGYFRYGVGNNLHQLTLLSGQERYHLTLGSTFYAEALNPKELTTWSKNPLIYRQPERQRRQSRTTTGGSRQGVRRQWSKSYKGLIKPNFGWI